MSRRVKKMVTRLLALGFVLLAGALVTSAAPASASQRALRILIAFSDGAHTEQTLKQDLAAVPGVATVDTFDASTQTPTVGLFDNYDAVVVYSNTDYADPTTLGNNLAAYADLGGQVVEFGSDWDSRAQRRPGGRWANSGYSPYAVGGTTTASSGGLGEVGPSVPSLSGIGALNSNLSMDPSVAAGSVELATWSDGRPALAFKGRALGVNSCVADGCGAFDPGFARVIANAALSGAAGQLVTPNTGCAADTFMQTSVSDGNPYFVQRSGVVTSWYSQAAAAPISNLELKVSRQGAPSSPFTIVGTSPAGAQQPNQINGPYRARIAVNGSDVIGLFTDGATGLCALGTSQMSDSFSFRSGDVPTGTTVTAMDSSGARFSIEAVVEPDLDHDGFGDLTQDACPAVPGPQKGCPAGTTPTPQTPPQVVAPAGTPATLSAAVVSSARETNRRWRESRHSKLARVSGKGLPVGTTFTFSLDRPAAVRLDFVRRGRVSGTLRIAGHQGRNGVHFLGYLTRKKRLRPGRYIVRITATTPGAGSSSRTLSFTIVR